MAVDIYKPNANDSLSLQELRLYHEIMAYRAEKGLGAGMALTAADFDMI